jgi:hypothetical protein
MCQRSKLADQPENPRSIASEPALPAVKVTRRLSLSGHTLSI